MLKVAFLAVDSRVFSRDYGNPEATFGTAPEAVLQGLARLRELEVHVISCTQQPMRSQEKIADNIWFHSLHVSKMGWMRTAYLGCILAVRRKVRELRADLVH